MLLIDENISELEVARLRKWGIRVRLVGEDVAKIGTTDENVLTALLQLKRPVLFTQDADFFRRRLLHVRYGLVWLDFKPSDVAAQIRRFLKHPQFDTQAKRLGLVARVHPDGVQCWRLGLQRVALIGWID
jgi:hypothetical protein